MKEGWKEIHFKDFITLNRGFDLPNNKIEEGDYPVVASTSIKAYNKKYKVSAPCVITGRSGSLGTVQFVNQNSWPLNTTLYVKDFKKHDPRFVYYFLQTMNFDSFNSGAGVPTLNQNHLHFLKINIPKTTDHQQRIASILYTYDDLIEVNNKRIELLEQSAHELYKEWFVRMRFPNYQNTKFNKGIPEGWEIVRIDNLYNTSAGGTPKSDVNSYYENGNINFVKTGDLNDSFIQDTPTKITELGLKNSSAKIFPSYTVIFAMYGNTIGKMGVLAKEAATNQACCAITPKTKIYNWEYIFYSLYIFREQLISLGMGAAQQNINQDEIKKFKIYKPEEELIERFNKIVSLNFNQIENLQKQNQQLTEIRNRLLPRLISGKLEVKE